MSKKETPDAAAAAATATKHAVEPPGGWPRDAYTGHYGRFVRDPVTGVRAPADDDTRRAMEALGIHGAEAAQA